MALQERSTLLLDFNEIDQMVQIHGEKFHCVVTKVQDSRFFDGRLRWSEPFKQGRKFQGSGI